MYMTESWLVQVGDLGSSLALDNEKNLYILQYTAKADEHVGIEPTIHNIATC